MVRLSTFAVILLIDGFIGVAVLIQVSIIGRGSLVSISPSLIVCIYRAFCQLTPASRVAWHYPINQRGWVCHSLALIVSLACHYLWLIASHRRPARNRDAQFGP